MKTLKNILVFCLMLVSVTASAQIKRVSGTVSDDFDVLPGVNVQEVDASGRTVNATVTDMNGNFVLAIKSQKNKLKVSYVGFKPQILPINKTVFKIELSDNTTTLKDVEVKAKKMMKTSGLAIPEREISFAAQGISAKEFEGLGITSVDEALQGRIAGLDIVLNSGDLGAGTTMRLRGVNSISTMTKSNPLVVVNGNKLSESYDNFDFQNATQEDFADLLKVNPEDIEEITVLKDAVGTAVWGADGANGVIEIKTKRGSRGPAKVGYSFKLTMTNMKKPIKMLDGDHYTMMLKEAFFNPGQNDLSSDINEISYRQSGFSERFMYDNNTDWVDAVKQTGILQTHYVNISGGDEKTTFRISGGFDSQSGTIIKQSLQRFSTRMALDYWVNDRIKITSNFDFGYTRNNKNYSNLLGTAYAKMPNLAIYREYENGVASNDFYYQMASGDNAVHKYLVDGGVNLTNPIAEAHLAMRKNTNYHLQPDLIVEYKLLGKGPEEHQLNYRGQVYLNINNDFEDCDYPRQLSTSDWLDLHTASSYSNKSFNFVTKHQFIYIPHFQNEDHSVNLMGRFELESGNNNQMTISSKRLPDGVSTPVAGGLPDNLSSFYSEFRKTLFFFQAHYAYKSKYMFDFVMGFSGSSNNGPMNRWSYFPGIGLRWNVIDENFMQFMREKAKMSMLSIRAGWGINGNQASGAYLHLNTYSTNKLNTYLGNSAMIPDGLKLTQLKPEMVYKLNVGFDIGFLDDRFKLSFEVYQNRTYDMLLGGYRIPSTNGFGALNIRNVGDLKNTGWEFFLDATRLAEKGKFWLDVNINFADNKNVITNMDPSVMEDYNSTLTNLIDVGNNQVIPIIQLNQTSGGLYGFHSKGVYQYGYDAAKDAANGVMPKALQDKGIKSLQEAIDAGYTFPVVTNANGKVVYDADGKTPRMMRCNYKISNNHGYKFQGGDAIYEDVNHDGNINKYDIVYLGNSIPKLTGGFGFKIHWDRLTLNAQFNYRYKYDIFNRARLNNEAMETVNNQSEAVNYRWRKDGDVTTIPRAMTRATGYVNYNTLMSDRFIEDGSFLRLNYLSLTYSFDPKLIKKIGLNQLNLQFSASNLFILTNYSGLDPEFGNYGHNGTMTNLYVDGATTPRSRNFTFSVNVGF